ncbi:MAG: VWA domain-containing protein, partial [Solirubrobacteraceae bacterium]
MAEKRPGGTLVATALVAAVLELLALAGPAAAASARAHRTATTVSGWLSAASVFPHRTLILAPSASTTLLPGAFHVSENGVPVSPLSVTPVANASAGAVGLVIAIDRNASMNGPGIAGAMAAARQLASLRRPGQLLGAIAFDSSPQPLLGLTGSAAAIGRSLASTPQLGSGDDPAAAVSAAVAQLSAAHVTLGAVVVISDGAGLTTASARAARAAAAATHTPVITIGLRDAAATPASLQALSRVDPGQFTTAAAGQLPSVVAA